MTKHRPARDERGVLAIQSMVSIGLLMGLLFTVGVLLMWQVGNGMVHSAADQGARAGSRSGVDSVTACEERARSALVNLLPGPGPAAEVECSEAGGVVSARVRLTLTGGPPPFSTVDLDAGASARKEVDPSAP